jgi:hypothetical protein
MAQWELSRQKQQRLEHSKVEAFLWPEEEHEVTRL